MPDNPSFVGAVALPSLLGKRLRLLPAATSAVAGQFRVKCILNNYGEINVTFTHAKVRTEKGIDNRRENDPELD
jgi:hypothetical protein